MTCKHNRSVARDSTDNPIKEAMRTQSVLGVQPSVYSRSRGYSTQPLEAWHPEGGHAVIVKLLRHTGREGPAAAVAPARSARTRSLVASHQRHPGLDHPRCQCNSRCWQCTGRGGGGGGSARGGSWFAPEEESARDMRATPTMRYIRRISN